MQQLNLYQKKFYKRELGFEKPWFKLLSLVTVAAIVLGNIVAGHRLYQIEDEISRNKARSTQLDAKINLLKKTIGDGKKDPQLDEKIAKLQKKIAERRVMTKNLYLDESQDSEGFSGRLIAFAKASMPGVWLENVSINQQNNEIIMEGKMSRPEALPDYIARLAKQHGFEQLGFNTVKVAEQSFFEASPEQRKQAGTMKKAGKDQYVFYISTTRATKPAAMPEDSLEKSLKEKAGEILLEKLPLVN